MHSQAGAWERGILAGASMPAGYLLRFNTEHMTSGTCAPADSLQIENFFQSFLIFSSISSSVRPSTISPKFPSIILGKFEKFREMR
jgi:hypothetical protein